MPARAASTTPKTGSVGTAGGGLSLGTPKARATPPKPAPAPVKARAPYVAPKPAAPAPRPVARAAAAPSGGGGGAVGSGGGFSGGATPVSYGGGEISMAAAAPAGPVMEDVTIPDPLADPTYQRQKAELARAKADFDASAGLARGQYDNTVNENFRQMGWRGDKWDPRARGTAYGSAFEGNEGDFAGRGLIHSGLYAQANGDLNQDFNDRRSGVLTAQKDWRDTQDLSKRNFEGQQNVVDLQAIQDAIAGIAAKYSVNTDQVTQGRQNVIQREKV